MEIMIRILAALGIVFVTGLIVGILWGIYIGERENVMKLSKIKIKDSFKKTKPNGRKMKYRWTYYRKTGYFYSPIVVDKDNYLIDGYISYLIAKADGLKEVEVNKIYKW